ncbi:thiamine diphosphokinase [Staphylococcus sp. FSL W8-1270]|uniref:thiamine diphosphokinase n=1 Tax=Staphylococcus sp. FSL W8-1270 TaxID=2954652 RepID=UPI0030F8EFEC
MKINLLCGDRHLPPHIFSKLSTEPWGGIDRGTLILSEHSIVPVFSVGDFDSVNDEEREILKKTLNIHPVKAEKDDTDLALGVEQAIQKGYTEIDIYGATGGRLDHFMGTLQILFKSDYIKKEIIIKVIDKQNEIMLLNTGTHQLRKSDKYQYVSFIPVNGEVILSLSGFKYNLNHQHLEIGSTLTISNEVNRSMAIIEVEKGQVLQMRSRDLE